MIGGAGDRRARARGTKAAALGSPSHGT
jgi:hypothetical protein